MKKRKNELLLEEIGGKLISKTRVDEVTFVVFELNGFKFERRLGNLIRFCENFKKAIELLKNNNYEYMGVVGISETKVPIINIKDNNGFLGNIDFDKVNNYIKTNRNLNNVCKEKGHKILSFCKNSCDKILIDFNCGHRPQWIILNYYLNNKECRVCSNTIIEVGVNDIATTNPEIMKYLVDKHDGYSHTFGSGDKVLTRCVCCGFESKRYINSLPKGFNCPICNDNLSIGEKIMYTILSTQDIEFDMHKTFGWSDRKEYDFYIPNKNCIIEMHGIQHYDGSFESMGGRTLQEEQENDKLKEQLARENGVEHYIVIDARKSNFVFITQNIISSKLFDVLDIQSVDWDLICKKTANSLVKKTWDLKNENKNITTFEISNLLRLNVSTIREWLKIGSELKKCKYDPFEESNNAVKRNASNNKRIVRMYDRNMVFLGEYESATFIENNSLELFGVFLYSSEIRRVCNKVKKYYKEFIFKYKYEYEYEQKTNLKKSKEIVLYKDGVECKSYSSCQELARCSLEDLGVKLQAGKISEVCNGKRKQHKGFTAIYR